MAIPRENRSVTRDQGLTRMEVLVASLGVTLVVILVGRAVRDARNEARSAQTT
jgi:hypothetical protein